MKASAISIEKLMKNEMKKIYYQVVENVLPQVYLLYNSFNNKFILLNNVRYEKYKKENILKLEQSDPVLYKFFGG